MMKNSGCFTYKNHKQRQIYESNLMPDIWSSEEVVEAFDIVLDYHIVGIVAFGLFLDKLFFKVLWQEGLDVGGVLLILS